MPLEFKIESDVVGLDKFASELGKKVSDIVRDTTEEVNNAMKNKIMAGPKTGRIYERGERTVSFLAKKGLGPGGFGPPGKAVSFTAKRGSKAKAHQASAPGESPATDYGFLVNSINWKMLSKYVGASDVGAKYGKALEMGTADGRIKPRPFLRPSVKQIGPRMNSRVKAACADLENGR